MITSIDRYKIIKMGTPKMKVNSLWGQNYLYRDEDVRYIDKNIVIDVLSDLRNMEISQGWLFR